MFRRVQVPKRVELSGASVDVFGLNQPELEGHNETKADRESATAKGFGGSIDSRKGHSQGVWLVTTPSLNRRVTPSIVLCAIRFAIRIFAQLTGIWGRDHGRESLYRRWIALEGKYAIRHRTPRTQVYWQSDYD
jgi:hypothetical protein